MNPTLEILETAISDVGQWRWWAESFPEVFQVEFVGTQLWNPPATDGGPPSGQIALRFKAPISVSFISKKTNGEPTPDHWPEKLHDDDTDYFGISYGQFAMQDANRVTAILTEALELLRRTWTFRR
jgi:hypothetical protein